jgi:hypothetical protein
MKSKYWTIFLTFVLLAGLGAFAESKTEHSVTLTNAVQVGSTQLQPGQYKVAWQGTGPAVQVEFQQHGKTVAASDARLVEQNRKSPYDAVVTDKGGSQSPNLKEIDFHNEQESLVFAAYAGT